MKVPKPNSGRYISVVIPTRNRARILRRCLDSLLRQTLPKDRFEVIVADNRSNDDTRQVCEHFSGRFPNFHYLRVQRPGLHNGRHAGMKHANGDILVYGDDDIEASATWLDGVQEGFARPGVALVGGPTLPNFEAPPPLWFESLKKECDGGWWIGPYSLIDLGDQVREISPVFVFGCNFSIRKDILAEVGGFHPDGMPKDDSRFRGDGETAVSEAIKVRGLKAIYHPKAAVRHLVSTSRMTPEYLRRRAYLQGISDSYRQIRKRGSMTFRSRLIVWIRVQRGLFGQLLSRESKFDWIQRIRAQGYWCGYSFHQQEVWRDPALLKWVLKPSYMNDYIW